MFNFFKKAIPNEKTTPELHESVPVMIEEIFKVLPIWQRQRLSNAIREVINDPKNYTEKG